MHRICKYGQTGRCSPSKEAAEWQRDFWLRSWICQEYVYMDSCSLDAYCLSVGFAKVPARPEDGIAASPGSHAYMAGDQPDFRNYNGPPMPSAGQALQAAVSSPEMHQNGWQQHREASPAAPSELQQMLRDLCGTNDPDLESDIRVINGRVLLYIANCADSF